MWKPGTAAPPRRPRTQTPPPRPRSPKNDGAKKSVVGKSEKKKPPGSGGSGGVKKKLSGATLGMRFMKRKADADEAAKRRLDSEARAQAEKEKMEWEARGQEEAGGAVDVPMAEDDDVVDDHVVIPQAATVSDMYGAEADIIGRRSFGGFNKTVAEAWDEALQMRARDRSSSKADGQQITDEELIRRYERIVKGRSDNVPVGNLAEKTKKRRSSGQSGDREKRKRG